MEIWTCFWPVSECDLAILPASSFPLKRRMQWFVQPDTKLCMQVPTAVGPNMIQHLKCQFGPVRAHVSGIGGLEYGQRPSRLGWLFHERLRWPQPLSLAELSPRDDELLQKVLEWARSYEGKIQRSRSESSKLAHFKHIKLEGFSSHEVVNS
jgi:hypothetical protein